MLGRHLLYTIKDLDETSPELLLARQKQSSSAKIVIALWTLVDRVSDVLFNQTSALSESELANILVESFNHLHSGDQYFPRQEPLPGETSCPFCGKDVASIKCSLGLHARGCQLKHLLGSTRLSLIAQVVLPKDAKTARTARTCNVNIAVMRHAMTTIHA